MLDEGIEMKEPSLFEEDYPPVGGAGFYKVNVPTVDEVMQEIAEGEGDWSARVQSISNFGELPVSVAHELLQHIAASNDGSMKRSREYLESIIEELI